MSILVLNYFMCTETGIGILDFCLFHVNSGPVSLIKARNLGLSIMWCPRVEEESRANVGSSTHILVACAGILGAGILGGGGGRQLAGTGP